MTTSEADRQTPFEREQYAREYHDARTRAPADLVPALLQYARVERASCVVDLGCGTGLSTGLWVDAADEVIGVEPAAGMLAVARARVAARNVVWRQARSDDTGLPAGCADIVVATQAFHWMEPSATLAEVARILRPGGVFAVADADMPFIDAEVEQAAYAFVEQAHGVRRRLGVANGFEAVPTWPKTGHLEQLQSCGHFSYVRELVMHRAELLTADRFVAQTISVCVECFDDLRAAGASAAELGLATFRELVEARIRPGAHWFIGYRVRLGVRA